MEGDFHFSHCVFMLLAEADQACVPVTVAILDGRQKRAEELRRLSDQSASLTEEQLAELRADIKVHTQQ